jgi:HNH endonuclease
VSLEERCPYCLQPYSPANPPTRDHVFPQSLGGRAVLVACKNCNNERFGSRVEGAFQGAGTVYGFMRHLAGDAGKRFAATIGADERSVEVDLVNQEMRARRPVTSHGAGRYSFRGSPQQVRFELERAAPKLGLSDEEIGQLLDGAVAIDLGSGTVHVVLSYDLALATRLGAKAALGCLVLARPDADIESTLAARLRTIALGDASYEQVHKADDQLLQRIRDYATSGQFRIGRDGNAVVYLGRAKGRSVVYTLVGAELLPPFGLIVEGEMPDGDLIATVVEDCNAGVRVTGIADILAAAANRLAETDPE